MSCHGSSVAVRCTTRDAEDPGLTRNPAALGKQCRSGVTRLRQARSESVRSTADVPGPQLERLPCGSTTLIFAARRNGHKEDATHHFVFRGTSCHCALSESVAAQRCRKIVGVQVQAGARRRVPRIQVHCPSCPHYDFEFSRWSVHGGEPQVAGRVRKLGRLEKAT